MELYAEAEELARKVDDRRKLCGALVNQAILAVGLGRPEYALPRAKEAHTLAIELGLTSVDDIQHIIDSARSSLIKMERR